MPWPSEYDFTTYIASGGARSGAMASGQIGNFHIASGQIQGLAGAGVPNIASGTFTGFELGSGSVISGRVASGQIGFGHLADNSVQSGSIASGQLSRFHVASGSLAGFELGSGAIVSGRIASGQVGVRHYADGSIQSGAIGSGQLASGHMDQNFITNIAGATNSGQVEFGAQFAGGTPSVSGATGDRLPGPEMRLITAEIISGGRAVRINSSGRLEIAMASLSGRAGACGVSLGNALSGLSLQWAMVGTIQHTSGMADYSGYLGRRIWVGRSGQLVTISGSWNSGSFASTGDVWMAIGYAANSGGVVFNVTANLYSGAAAQLLPWPGAFD